MRGARVRAGQPSPETARDPGARVLVSDHVDGRSRSAVAAVRALAAAGYRPLVTVSGRKGAAARSRGCAGVVPVPSVSSPTFRAAVQAHLAAEPGSTVLPASDAVLVALGLPGAALVDKSELTDRAGAAGLQTPPTRRFASGADLLAASADLDFPLVIKASVKVGAGEVSRRIDDVDGLVAAAHALRGAVVVQPFVTGRMRAVCGVTVAGRLVAVVHQDYVRIWPPGCGTASAAITTGPDLDLEDRLPTLLAGHSGIFQVQLIEDFVIDVNPRVYGSLPLAVAAGANLPAIACRAAAGQAAEPLVRGRPGVRYRWLEGDLRSVLHGLRHDGSGLRAAGRALRPRRRTAHSVESVRDPGPFLARLAEVAGTVRR